MGAPQYDVAVAGLGPVGAALAALLDQAGLKTLAFDKSTEVYPLPRAAHFDHEIMRIFQRLDIVDEVLAAARPAPAYEFRAADGKVLMRMNLPVSGSPSGWATGYMFHQPSIENALRARLAASPRCEVRLGVAFEGLEDAGDHVRVRIAGPDGAETVTARYLVGCDGASSLVRQTLGIGLSDYAFDEPWLVVDAKLADDATPPDINLQLCDPERPVTCVLMGPGRHRWEFMLKPGETPEEVVKDEFLLPLIAKWNVGPVELERRAVYRFHGLVAEQWARGRVLLAGDSAHQTPPFAGQGMCSGIRDAENLAWKLIEVLQRGAEPAIFDSYQSEREPHVRGLIELAINMGRVVCATDPAEVAERDARMLAAQAAGAPPIPPAPMRPLEDGVVLKGSPAAGAYFPQPWAGEARLDDVLGQDAWLICKGAAPKAPAGITAASLDEDRLAPFAGALTAWLDAQGGEAVLVRPDRYVFGTGAPAELALAWTRALGRA